MMYSNFLTPTPGTPRDRDNRYYQILGGGARMRMLETFLDLQLPELLGKEGPLPATEICKRLNLVLDRGWKFLHLLALSGLLQESKGLYCEDDAVFGLSKQAKEYFGEDGAQGYFFRDLVNFWKNVACLPLIDVLQGLPLPDAVRWPPATPEAAEHLEKWMRVTALGAIKSILASNVMIGGERLLDVGGGDGTIGCAMLQAYPELNVTVFNLPASAALAREVIKVKNQPERINVHEGDFLKDELPGGFDRILFSRVLTDWTPSVCRMLFEKSRRALVPGGKLVINEAFVEGNLDYSISWEFRYIFYDTFGRAMFKPLDVYRKLLNDAGFKIAKVYPMLDDAFYSVIEAIAI